MTITKATTNHYNLKRAERFKTAGINDADVAYATPTFAGVENPTFECSLCDHPHCVYNFTLHFDAPNLIDALAGVHKGIHRTDTVTFTQVGSTCITNWLDALPETAAKLAALQKWYAALKAMNSVKKALVVASLCEKAGYESPEAAFDAYSALDFGYSSAARKALTRSERKTLKRNRYSVKNATSTRKTVQTWLALLATALAAPTTTVAPVAAPAPVSADPLAKLSAEDRKLIERYQVHSDLTALSGYYMDAIKDIAFKVVKFGSFAPGGKQRGFFTSMVESLEKAASPAPVAAPVAKPAAFVSPSGISGARY